MAEQLGTIKALIFDMDGVIVDSMPQHVQAWYDTFNANGIDATREAIFSMEGYKLEDVIRNLGGGKVSAEEMRQLEDEKHRNFNDEEIEIFPEVRRLLPALQDRLKLAVVTGSNRREVNKLLPSQIADNFEFIISSEDYEQGKPHPNPYLTAVDKLGVAKDQVVVVENAPAGVTSAKRAGLKVIGLPTYVDQDKLKKADILVDNHQELETILEDYY